MSKFVIFIALVSFSLNIIAQDQTYEELVSRAIDYQEAQDYVAAEQVLKEAMRKEPANPGNTLLLSNLGTIQRILGKKDEALISYSIALGRHPNAVFVLQNRAALYCDIDSINLALQDYNLILSIDKENIDALYSRGLIQLNKKNYLAAESDFEQIKTIEPNNLNANMGLALIVKQQGNWKKAEELYSDLIYDYKTNDQLYLNRAECYLELQKLARTQEDLNKAANYGNNSPFLYILKGRLKLLQYDNNAAKEYFLKAQDLGANKLLIDDYLKLCRSSTK
ncbi:hypothetical protein D0T53_12780 [Dysgonomonas sp. 216]|uniref:tetratricopeptide repeat protein n=1 Tax=Dysgonomonas sp. 216 TaxID=2302934 RepID=UPI0013D5B80D|nr:tetratricopeptide repeat protein [Dysgonomonas sp. 216]NDW19774.1 hypothetical protein [Dysgonomonas sp. 216]